MTSPTRASRRTDGAPVPSALTSGLIALVFLVNLAILGYAIHITRPQAHGEGEQVAAAPDDASLLPGESVADRAAPIVPGLHGRHALAPHQVGEVLIGALRCTACHAPDDPARWGTIGAPDLSDVGARVAPDFLRRFIAAPSAADPGTAMPDMLAGRTLRERSDIAEAITAFLVAQSERPFRRDAVAPDDVAAGRAVFHAVGCVACHGAWDGPGAGTTSEGMVALDHVAAKYGLDALAAFLFQPLEVRPSGRMPDMSLTRSEARAVASALMSTPGPSILPGSPDAPDSPADVAAASLRPELVARGRASYEEFRCNACHQLDGIEAAAATPLAALDADRGCLGHDVEGTPEYGLDDEQVRAIRLALAVRSAAPADEDRIALTLTAFNCIACHVRDDYGGVAPAHDAYFTTSEPALGEEARIPPPLTLVGAKLRAEAVHKALFDGEIARPYMHVRMPQFGPRRLGFLPDLLARTDEIEPVDLPAPDGDEGRVLRDAGRTLVGDQGLNCVACHNFNGKASPGFKGIDLVAAASRLQPSWFARFLLAPGAQRPGITMPSYWPDGQSVRPEILDGDVDAQVRAILHYLGLGRTAADPPGIRSDPTRLEVSDTTRLYRGRSRIAGFRGIAVGFPEGISYAWNAETGALSGLWLGDFVNVNWNGQAAGDFTPASRPIALAQDVAFVRGDDAPVPWPLRPVMTEEDPVNPDPLYPRHHGYGFGGYYFDDAWVPTLMYRCGPVSIEDRSVAERVDGRTDLVRTLAFSSRTAETLWLRVLTGRIESVAGDRFARPDLQVTVPGGSAVLRPFGSDGDQELLLELALPAGASTVTIRYEPLQ